MASWQRRIKKNWIKVEAVVDDAKGSVARMIQKLEEERKEEENAKEEILAAVNCPAEGFHGEEEAGDSKEGAEMEEETEPALDQDQKFLKVVVEHIRNFVSMSGNPSLFLS